MKETLEQTAAKFAPVEIGNESHNRGRDENSFAREAFITGAKWQQEHGQKVGHSVPVGNTELAMWKLAVERQEARCKALNNIITSIQENTHNEKDVIDLIQFLSMNQEFNGYGSVSKETAKYFLEQFKKQ
jgi:hypothetical protein